MSDSRIPPGFSPEQMRKLQETARQAQATLLRLKPIFEGWPPPLFVRLQADIAQINTQTRDIFKAISPRLALFSESMRQAFEALRPTFEALVKEREKAEMVEGSGWLPHHTTPFDQISQDHTTEDVRALLDVFYRDHWDDVRDNLLSSVQAMNVDSETKETFAEAVRAHERGDFRCAPRVLFPEVERVARYKLKLRDFNSRRDLIDHANELPASVVLRELSGGLKVLEKLVDHLYLKVDETTLAQVAADPVPNRHAAIHGRVVYKTRQSSLNAILVAEFAFLFIDVLERYLQEDQDPAEPTGGPSA